MHANRKLLMAAALALASAAAWAQGPYRMTLSGASPSGLWTILGVGIDGAVKASFPGSTITYQTSGGGFANIALLDQGKVELGLAHDAELRVAQQGGKPFTKPVTSLRAIALMYDWAPMQMVMNKAFAEKHGIRTFDDIAVKKPPLRVAFNKRGNITEHVAVRMFNAIGVSLDDDADIAERAARQLGASFPIVVSQRLAGRYAVSKIPLTFVVDGAGVVRWVGRDTRAMRQAVEFLLRE